MIQINKLPKRMIKRINSYKPGNHLNLAHQGQPSGDPTNTISKTLTSTHIF